jgi:hypothetical protein
MCTIARTSKEATLVPDSLSARQTRLLRLSGQRLLPSRLSPSVPAAAHAIAGFQAQSWPDALLGVHSRTRDLTAAHVERARVEDRTVVRSWFMRGTLHLVATEDVGWLLGLLGPGQIAAGWRRREELGLDEATYASAVSVLEAELAEGPKTRAEIDDVLVRHGVRLKPKTQAAIHLIQRAALEGRVCYGADRGRQKELVLLRAWVDVGPALDPDVALVEVARRYLAAFAPASPADFAKWSKLPMPLCRRAFAELDADLGEVRVWGVPAWIPRASLAALAELERAEPVVRLLGGFDTLLIGIKDRRNFADERWWPRIWVGGLIMPVVMVDGEVVATWKLERGAGAAVVRVSPFEPLDEGLMPAVEAEVADVGWFLGVSARLVVAASENVRPA